MIDRIIRTICKAFDSLGKIGITVLGVTIMWALWRWWIVPVFTIFLALNLYSEFKKKESTSDE